MSSQPLSNETFLHASKILPSLPGARTLPQASQLRLYSLYKFILTSSKTPTSSRPGMFDFAGRSKWDSWNSLSKEPMLTKEGAEEEYINVVKSCGWDGSLPSTAEEEGGDIEELLNAPDVPRDAKGKGAAGQGLGEAVSVIALSEDAGGDEEGGPHQFVVNNDIEGLKVYLLKHPEGVNLVDQYSYTPLHLAADRGHHPIVQFLLSNGADRTILDEDGNTAAALAAIGDHTEIVKLLGV